MAAVDWALHTYGAVLRCQWPALNPSRDGLPHDHQRIKIYLGRYLRKRGFAFGEVHVTRI